MAATTPPNKLTLLSKLDKYFEDRQQMTLWMTMIFTFLFGLLLFEPKVSTGGDDSMYINRAYNFIKKDTFPTFQGPLYPIFLGLIIYLVGMKLIVFKFISLLCLAGSQWFTFKLFRNYLSPFILFVFFLLVSTSSAILYYGSATYNESFYLVIQSIFLYYFVKSFINKEEEAFNFKNDIREIILTGALLFLLAITKNIGLVAVIAVVFYFLILKKWKSALMVIGSFGLFMILFKIVKTTFWDIKDIQISGQLSTLLTKVPYKIDSGTEDAFGFFMRLVENSWVYLGYHFVNIFGMAPDAYIDESIFATVFIYAVFIYGFIVFFKKSRFWLFIGLFLSISFGSTFLILQTYWIQERLIIVFTPLLLAYLLHALYFLFYGKLRNYSIVFIVFLGFMVAANLLRTFSKIPLQVRVNTAYIAGDTYYGFTEDWANYLKMTKWTSDNLGEDAFVACRKPGMAFVYGDGKDFYGIFRVPVKDGKILYETLKNAGVTHVIMANLRTNSNDPNTRVINTVSRYLGHINEEYPDKLKLIHQVGDNWPAYLYELN